MTTGLIIAAILVGAVAIWSMQRKSPKREEQNKEDSSQHMSEEEKVEVKINATIENIIKGEEKFALNNQSNPRLLTELKSTCNQLLDSVPIMNREFPQTEVAFNINEISNKNLPDKINSFVSLDKDEQIARTNEFVNNLEKFKKIALKANGIIKQTNLSKDERESLLISIKY